VVRHPLNIRPSFWTFGGEDVGQGVLLFEGLLCKGPRAVGSINRHSLYR
jgi:hypothetical protein